MSLERRRSWKCHAAIGALVALSACSSTKAPVDPSPQPADLSQALFVATADGQLSSFDAASGATRAGTVTQVLGPVDMQALPGGYVGVNLSTGNQVLFVDARTMLEVARIPSSRTGGVKPVHAYLSPVRQEKQYWLAFNDGDGTAASNSALFIDVAEGSARRFQAAGEVGLGIGHHKAAFSTTQERVVISNISDCDEVFQVFDYADPAGIQELKAWSAADLGFDCAATKPVPHGCASSQVSGKAYCNFTGTGEIAAIDLDANPPAIAKLTPPLGGSGSGATAAHPGGRYVYTAHATPREGQGGVDGQIGSISVVDGQDDGVTDLPLRYDGAGGTAALAGTDASEVGISHLTFSADGALLFVIPGSGSAAEQRARRVLVLDTRDPAHPRQLPSITVGASHGDNSDALSGDGKTLFVTNNADTTVSAIDVASLQVTRTFDTHAGAPKVVATYGTAEGPSKPAHE
jgi:YVTN family beta-propeller protein